MLLECAQCDTGVREDDAAVRLSPQLELAANSGGLYLAWTSVISLACFAKSSYASSSSLPASSCSADSGFGWISRHLTVMSICPTPYSFFQSFLSVDTQISPVWTLMFGWKILVTNQPASTESVSIYRAVLLHTFGRSSRKVRAEFEAYLEVTVCIVSEVSQTMTSLDHSERD